jgi:hypothetical protein
LKANHNKDYSVVKTFKAAKVAFLRKKEPAMKIAGSFAWQQNKNTLFF